MWEHFQADELECYMSPAENFGTIVPQSLWECRDGKGIARWNGGGRGRQRHRFRPDEGRPVVSQPSIRGVCFLHCPTHRYRTLFQKCSKGGKTSLRCILIMSGSSFKLLPEEIQQVLRIHKFVMPVRRAGDRTGWGWVRHALSSAGTHSSNRMSIDVSSSPSEAPGTVPTLCERRNKT